MTIRAIDCMKGDIPEIQVISSAYATAERVRTAYLSETQMPNFMRG